MPKENKSGGGHSPAAVPRRWRRFTLTGRAAVWAALWVGALVFTQMLRSSASNIFFVFVTLFPAASLLYALFARSGINVYMVTDSADAQKLSPFRYEFRLINERRIPCPFIDAFILLPRKDSVKCSERLVKVSMAPGSDYTVSGTVSFRFRGTYEIGVTSVYVYDFFRMFRLRSDFDSFVTVSVLPRRLIVKEDAPVSVSDSVSRSSKSPLAVDKIEMSDTREYRMGDALKSVHWKLSSKTEELIVRDFNTGSNDRTYVLCDLSSRFPSEAPVRPFVDPYADPSTLPPPDVNELASDEYYANMNEFCADGVIELAVASVLREIRARRTVVLMWFDRRSDIGAFSFELKSVADFDTVFRLFATAPLAPASDTVGRLAAMINESGDARYVFVIPSVDNAVIAELCSVPCLPDASAGSDNEAVVYDCGSRYAHPDLRLAYLEASAGRLAESGIKLVTGNLDDVIVLSAPADGKEASHE